MQVKQLCKNTFSYSTIGWSVIFNLGNVVKLHRNTVRKGDKSIPTVIPILSLQSDFKHNAAMLNYGSACQAIVWHQHLHSCCCFTEAAAIQTCDGVGGSHSIVTVALCYTKETYWDNSPHVFLTLHDFNTRNLLFEMWDRLISRILEMKITIQKCLQIKRSV